MQVALNQTQQHYAQFSTWSNSPVGIEIGLLACAAPNAMSIATESGEFVGVTPSMISLVQEVFWSLGTYRHFLPGAPGGNDRWNDPVDIAVGAAADDHNVGATLEALASRCSPFPWSQWTARVGAIQESCKMSAFTTRIKSAKSPRDVAKHCKMTTTAAKRLRRSAALSQF